LTTAAGSRIRRMSPQPYRLHVQPPDDDAAEGRMGFLEHLDELRTRIIRSCIAIGVGMVVAFAFYDRLADIVLDPITRSLPPGTALVFIRPGEGFAFYLNISLIGGFLLAAPFVMHQVWRFIAPGLYANEKKFAVPFVLMSTTGFVGGAAFNHYIIFPFMMTFFASFNTADLIFMPRLEDVFDLYSKMLIGMGLVFQMPTVVFFLAKMRMVTARFLLRNTKYAVLAIFVIAAVITPSGDMVTQTIFAAPMLGLYALSILIAWIVTPKSEIS
jgi:sec-independent protein translocase protein TatC